MEPLCQRRVATSEDGFGNEDWIRRKSKIAKSQSLAERGLRCWRGPYI